VDSCDSIVRILTPSDVLASIGDAVAVGSNIKISIEVHNFPDNSVQVATKLELIRTLQWVTASPATRRNETRRPALWVPVRSRFESAKGARVQIYRKPRKPKTKMTMTTKPTR
jgi:hypothetical protein